MHFELSADEWRALCEHNRKSRMLSYQGMVVASAHLRDAEDIPFRLDHIDETSFEACCCVDRKPAPGKWFWARDEYLDPFATVESVDDQRLHASVGSLTFVAAPITVKAVFEAALGKAHVNHDVINGKGVNSSFGWGFFVES